jgi:histidinol phosphatase-like enzyme
VADAQINSIHRMLKIHGTLPSPEVIRERAKLDPRYLLPDAQFRYERTLEPPTLDEGFASIDVRAFARRPNDADHRALMFDFDDLLSSDSPVLDVERVALDWRRLELLARQGGDGWRLFVHAWRPQIARSETTADAVDACLAKLCEIIGGDVDVACCPHDAGPPVCWCRKPIPGSVLEFATRRGVSLTSSIVVGSSAADRTLAERVGARFESSEVFFSGS